MKSIAFVVAGCLAIPAMAGEICSQDEAAKAEAYTDKITSWQALYSGYLQFRHCDDGSIAEGFQDRTVRLLASSWESLPEGAELMRQNQAFRTFVIRHIGATADTDELRAVSALAQGQCPEGQAELCRDIASASASAAAEHQ